MKIPKSVRIGGVEYDVVRTPELNTGYQMAYGHIDYEHSVIELTGNLDEKTCHQKLCVILLHEILHGVREHAGLEIENEEEVVDMFAKGLYQVLQDNGKRLFDIAESNEEGNS